MRARARTWEPEERRFVAGNMQCQWCGNTTGFSINLRLKHVLKVVDSDIVVTLEKSRQKKLERSLSSNIDRIVDKYHQTGNEIIRCANCEEAEGIDFQERILDYCWQMGCPGCWHCGQYLDEDEVLSLCSECITEKEGNLDEDDCQIICPYYDFGLGEVRDHYGTSIDELKRSLGY